MIPLHEELQNARAVLLDMVRAAGSPLKGHAALVTVDKAIAELAPRRDPVPADDPFAWPEGPKVGF